MTSTGSFVRIGFVDGAAAAQGIERLGEARRPLTDHLAATADPDAALAGLLRLSDALDEQDPGSGAAMLAELADERLRLRHGITRESDPRRARELLGDPLWAALHDRGRRSAKARELETYVDALERL